VTIALCKSKTEPLRVTNYYHGSCIVSELPEIDRMVRESAELIRKQAGGQCIEELDDMVIDLAAINPLITMFYHLGRLALVRDDCRIHEESKKLPNEDIDPDWERESDGESC